jgi:hypothetical protein
MVVAEQDDSPPCGHPRIVAGAALRTSLDVAFLLAPTGNQATWPLTIPNDPGLAGVNVLEQAGTFNFTSGCIASMSIGIRITVGW